MAAVIFAVGLNPSLCKIWIVRLWLVMRAITAVKTRQGSLITAIRFYDGALFLCLPEGLLAMLAHKWSRLLKSFYLAWTSFDIDAVVLNKQMINLIQLVQSGGFLQQIGIVQRYYYLGTSTPWRIMLMMMVQSTTSLDNRGGCHSCLVLNKFSSASSSILAPSSTCLVSGSVKHSRTWNLNTGWTPPCASRVCL